MYILFNFINRSNSTDASVVFFQKNDAVTSDGTAIAFKVIKNPVPGASIPYSFPLLMQVGATDNSGHYTASLDASGGDTFLLQRASTDPNSFIKSYGKGDLNQIKVYNLLSNTPANAYLYRDSKVFARLMAVRYLDNGIFEIKPVLWVGVLDQVAEGAVISAASLSSIKSNLPLSGVKSADIIMTGDKGAYNFTLENVVTG